MTPDPVSSDMGAEDTAQDTLTAVLDKLGEIARAASKGSFVFRGEPKCYEEISSSLYREYKTRLNIFGLQGFDIRHVQDEILEDAADYAEDLTPQELLSQLQHFGHPTNLIDFTSDYLIALFFACASEPGHDGRVILLNSEAGPLHRMRTPANRIKAQKSVFVDPPTGVIVPDETVTIPRDLKLPILGYLFYYHDISTRTIYDDIHGYIKNARVHHSAYAEFHIGGLYVSQGNPSEALRHYSNSIALNSSQKSSFKNRGIILVEFERYDEAIKDFTHAITLDPQDAGAHLLRGVAYFESGRPEAAERDYSEAIRLDEDMEDAYGGRAMARAELRNFEGVIGDMSSVIGLDPKRSSAYSGRGWALFATGNSQSALRDLDTAIELDPNYANAYSNRAQVHFDLGEYQNAIEDFSMYIHLGGGNLPNAHFRRGVAQVALEHFAEARADLETSLELEPSVAKRMFETKDHVSAFVQDLGLQKEIPADLLEKLNPREQD